MRSFGIDINLPVIDFIKIAICSDVPEKTDFAIIIEIDAAFDIECDEF